MKINRTFGAAVAALTLGLTSAAEAAVIHLSGSNATSGVPSLYEVNFDFALPGGFTNAVLTISSLVVDDRGVVQLNGTDVDAAGIFGPGAGFFDFGAGNVPYVYVLGNGARNVVVNSGFLAGVNTLRLIANDTNAGIFGSLVNGPNGPSATTAYFFNAQVTYDLADNTAVPEPATWALIIAGFGMTGAALRARRPVAIGA